MVNSTDMIEHESMTNEHDPNTDSPTDSSESLDGSDTMTDDRPVDDTPPPPPAPPPSAPRYPNEGLVRDPYASLGGVASGVAHRYGWSVPIVRLVFAAGFLASCGFATVLYLVAWAVIPRATTWPPTPIRHPGEGLRSRDIGIGIALVGVIAFLIAGGGSAASFLVPLALVLGGVWLLVQDQRELAPPVITSAAGARVEAFATQPPPIGQPVPPRSRGSKWAIRSLIGITVLAMLALVAIPIALIAASTDGNGFGFEFSTNRISIGATSTTPDSLADLPREIATDYGYVELDLTKIPASDFAALEYPATLNIDLGEGDVSIKLPDDLAVSLVAATDDGSVDIDGAIFTGAVAESDRVVVEHPDPAIEITINTGNGNIDIDTKP